MGQEPQFIMAMSHDISDQRRAIEEALRHSESRFRTLVRNIPDYAIFMVDPNGIIVGWWEGAERVKGYKRAEVAGKHLSLFYTPEDVSAGEVERELAEAAEHGRAERQAWRVRKGGERFWADEITTAIHGAEGKLLGFARIARDLSNAKLLTEQRERLLEEAKLARAQAERAMTMKDEFLAVVSHELKTPLGAVLLWSKLLESGSIKRSQRDEAIRIIRQSAESQQQLIEDLLDMSRISSGKLRLQFQIVELAAVIQSALGAVRPVAEARGISIKTSLKNTTDKVRADPDRLRQVIWNLLSNAVKFTEPGGRISVRLRRSDHRTRIEIVDTGRGIAPEFLPHMFEPFRQADSSTTREHGGLGLGLTIVRQLIELMGGTVRASSRGVGKGATFAIEMPLAQPKPKPPRPRAPKKRKPVKRTTRTTKSSRRSQPPKRPGSKN